MTLGWLAGGGWVYRSCGGGGPASSSSGTPASESEEACAGGAMGVKKRDVGCDASNPSGGGMSADGLLFLIGQLLLGIPSTATLMVARMKNMSAFSLRCM